MDAKPMKILMVSPYTDLSLGGVSHIVPAMIQATASEDLKIDWISTSPEPQDWREISPFSRGQTFSRWARHDLIWSPSMVSWFRAHVADYDGVHFHTIFAPMISRLASISFRAGVPYWMTPYGMLDPWAIQHRGWKKRIYWKLFEESIFRRANAVQVLHEREAEAVRSIGVTTRTVEVLNGIEPAKPLSDESVSAFWGRYPETAGKKRVLFLGRIHPKKGIDYLIRSLPDVFKEIPDLSIVIAGPDEGGTKESLEGLARELGVSDRMVWTGLLKGEEKQAALQGADCFVLPSHSEGFSQALLEAMISGVPTLYTKECYFDEAIETGGAWAIERNPSQIAATLVAVLMDLKDSKRKAQEPKKLVEDRYLWSSIGADLRGKYLSLAKTQRDEV
jgi:glycosyltransferase involved in cell wall biosynthesis